MVTMPYKPHIHEDTWSTWALAALLYGALLVAGILGIYWPTQQGVELWEESLVRLAGAATAAGGAVSLVSRGAGPQGTHRWTWEMVAVWPAAIGVTGYAVVIFTAMSPPEQRIIALVFVSLIAALAYRGVTLIRVQRQRHRLKQLAEAGDLGDTL